MGALSALPALDVKTPQPPNLLEQYSQLQQLRGNQQAMQQRAAMAPLQQQEAQQSVQQGGLQIQQQQQALKDQQAVTAAMQQWDGKDLNDLSPLILKNGGSGSAVIGLKQKQLDLQSKAAETFKNQADGGKAQADAVKTRNDQLAGALTPFTDATKVPDAQLVPSLTTTIQGLTQQGTLTPQDAQAASQLLQSGDPNAIRSGLKEFVNSHQALSQTIENAQKEAATAQDAAKTTQAQQETAFYAKNGGAPGVPTEAVQQADWLAKNPGKGPSDYVAWKAKQNPMAMVMGTQLGGNQNGQGNPALDLVANAYLKTGQMPPELSRSPGTITAVIQRASQLAAANGNIDLASNEADFKANKASLQNLQKNFDQVQAFEGTAGTNMDLYLNKLSQIPDLGVKFANVPMRMINASMIGTANYQAMQAAQQTASAEVAKVLSSANASGVLSDTQKKEAEDMLSGNLSLPAAKQVVATLKQDMANRTQAYQAQIGDIQNRVKNAGNTAPQGGAPKVGDVKTFPNGKKGVWDGQGYVAQ